MAKRKQKEAVRKMRAADRRAPLRRCHGSNPVPETAGQGPAGGRSDAAAEALRRNEARMRALLSAMPDLMFRIHRDGTYLDFHAERASDLAMPPGEIVGSNVRQLPLARETVDEALEAIARALATGAVQTLEYTLRTSEGPRHYESRTIASGTDEVVTIVRDITDRRRTEQWQTAQYAVTRVLAESQTIAAATPELLRAICEGLAWDLGELWHVDADADLLRWQGAYHRSSLDALQFISRRRETTFARSAGLPGRVWASGAPLWVDDVMADLPLRRTGSIARKVGLHSALGIPLRTRGEVLGVMVLFSRDVRKSETGLPELLEALGRQIGDFIERKRAEEAWRTSEERFAAFMRHLPGVAFIKDALGRYLFVNETFEEVHRCKLAEIAGKSAAELWPPEVARQLRQNDWLVMEGKRKLQVIETIPQDDGPHEWLASKFPIMDRDGTPIMLAGVAVDITEHKRAEASARQRQAELAHVLRVSTMGELAGGLAHELNQPLSAIANDVEACATYVRTDQGDTQVLLELLEHAASEALRAGEIIQHLRDFVEKREPQLAAVDLRDLIRSVARLLEPEMRRQQIALRLDPMPFPLPICADGIQIEQVLVNLVQNAADAVVEAGSARKEVRVQTALGEDGQVEVAVVDPGRGTSAAVAERMFEPFFTTKPRGLGMGLAISRSIVEAHRGRIWMTPRIDGNSGSAVRVSFPLLARAPSKAKPTHEP